MKSYGKLSLDVSKGKNRWKMTDVAPHVCIKLKAMFPRIPKAEPAPFFFDATPENAHDLLWFMERYPMDVSGSEGLWLQQGRMQHLDFDARLEEIMLPDYTPPQARLREGFTARDYQLRAAAFDVLQKRFLLGDDVGLGKTLEGILTLLSPGKLPALVVVQTHLPRQWKLEGIEKFTDLKAHIIVKGKPYDLPTADVYIISYSKLRGWVDVLSTGFIKAVIFDEVQELRRVGSDKYSAAKSISIAADHCLGMSATPIYNYGDEIFNILNLIKPDCLGDRWDFLREWAVEKGQDKWTVKDPAALGTYLRDAHLFLRRTRKEVGRELPPVNTIIQTVGYNESEVKKSEDLAKQLAIKVVSGSFVERGQAARELDALVRHQTGVSKAREVAAFVRILLENDEPALLAGWHRDVYNIWMEELADFAPVLYTGSETPHQKEISKEMFVSGKTNLFIISLRSGIGLDGLQARCRTVVLGELDWSPQVHHQLIGRIDREGQEDQVTAYFLVSDYGSDPVMIDVLGLKSSQAHGIINPLQAIPEQFSDDSRIKKLAETFLTVGKNGKMQTRLFNDENERA